MNGAVLGVFDLPPQGFMTLRVPVAGTLQLYLHGQLAQEVASSSDPCDPAVSVSGLCADSVNGHYWLVGNQRDFPVAVDLRLEGQPLGSVTIQPFDSQQVTNHHAGVLQALINGSVVAEAPSVDDPCPFPPNPPAVAPDRLPGTGGGTALVAVGLALAAAGLVLLAVSRRRPSIR
jgi:hypothetical protein